MCNECDGSKFRKEETRDVLFLGKRYHECFPQNLGGRSAWCFSVNEEVPVREKRVRRVFRCLLSKMILDVSHPLLFEILYSGRQGSYALPVKAWLGQSQAKAQGYWLPPPINI